MQINLDSIKNLINFSSQNNTKKINRISKTFTALKNQNRKALIPFITAGDPNPEITIQLMHQLVQSGADIIELGVPFSDPMADGPTIQRSSERALKHHVSLNDVLDMVAEMDAQGFGSCTNHRECEAACPKQISVDFISRLNREFLWANLKMDKQRKASTTESSI